MGNELSACCSSKHNNNIVDSAQGSRSSTTSNGKRGKNKRSLAYGSNPRSSARRSSFYKGPRIFISSLTGGEEIEIPLESIVVYFTGADGGEDEGGDSESIQNASININLLRKQIQKIL